MTSTERFSPLILRIGLGLLFMYYGISQFIFIQKKALPPRLLFYIPISESTMTYTLAVISIIIGLFILIGLFTRTFSVISAVGIFASMILAGISLESLGDFIAICISISLALSGSGSLGIDNLIRGRKSRGPKSKEYLEYDL